MKYAGIDVTKVTTINQPVTVAIFLVSMRQASARRAGQGQERARQISPFPGSSRCHEAMPAMT